MRCSVLSYLGLFCVLGVVDWGYRSCFYFVAAWYAGAFVRGRFCCVVSGRWHLLAYWFLAELISSTLKMEAICSFEMPVDTQRTSRRHIPEDDTLHNHRCENLKSYICSYFFICVKGGGCLNSL
jgi:hypothetical protein